MMKTLKSEKCLCPCCMEEHSVQTVSVEERSLFRKVPVIFEANYQYCENADEFYATASQIRKNDIRFKNAYRHEVGLLTSEEIVAIRNQYKITQSDLCLLLGWGLKTITRYESHQVQDKAHDSILRKIGEDPSWFLDMLEASKSCFLEESYRRYHDEALSLYEKDQDQYLRKAIEATYAKYQDAPLSQGKTPLSLDKVIEIIRYFSASRKVTNLYKVKLMKLMWYADALSYKLRGRAMTGLAYQALPMGAVPVSHNSIINLKNVPCEEEDLGETSAYRFYLNASDDFSRLNTEEKNILDTVIDQLGSLTTEELVRFMHAERAFTETAPKEIISFQYAEFLQI